MKKLAAVILVITLLCTIAEIYPRVGVTVNSVDGVVTVEDVAGNLWDFLGDNAVGDLVLMLLDDNGTSDNIDDSVIGAWRLLPWKL